MLNVAKKPESAVAQLIKASSDLVSIAKEGDLVTGTLIKRMPRAVYFDLSRFGTGVIYGSELMNAREILKNLKEGDSITAKVTETENDDGYVELSLAGASRQKSWQTVRELSEKGEEVTVTITGANAGGLMAEIEGLKTFLPVSQLSSEHYPRVDDGSKEKILGELKKFIGQEMKVKILDVNIRTDKLIISEREITSANVKEKLNKYQTGDVVDGIVSGVADFGAFMKFTDNPELEGLIHISELDHKLIENPKEIIKVNDQVKAKIIEIKDGRVTLSLKALKTDPWATVEERFKAGTEVLGTVLRFNPFGAFIGLDSDIQGLIHVSEFGSVEAMQEKIKEGQKYTFHIDSVKSLEKRIILKLKK